MKTISNNPIIQIYKNKISNCEACVISLRHHNIEAICELSDTFWPLDAAQFYTLGL